MDPEDELSEAFAAFDETDSGYVPVSQMRVFLSSLGDRMTEEEVSIFRLHVAYIAWLSVRLSCRFPASCHRLLQTSMVTSTTVNS